jgi:Mrp family chromosome partitioning ATPase
MIRYDDALPTFVALVADTLGPDALQRHLFLRDASGRLTLILRGDEDSEESLARLVSAAREALEPYVDSLVAATPEQLFDPSLAGSELGYWERFTNGLSARVFERWLVGQDWQTPPQPGIPGAPPVVVFASHKGGVGRSTALAVAAADFAARGYDVLVLDLDLEAPGIGAMLLPDDRKPAYGALDFFVENGLRSLSEDREFFAEIYGVSPLTRGGGLVHVVPAVGGRSEAHPQNVIGKIARAYLEKATAEQPKSFLDQTRDLIAELVDRHTYDVVLVDARAGLHETTATSILGLGADILLFGVDTPQTFEGYRFLLAYLARFIVPDGDDDWRLRLRLVHAKASADPARWTAFNDRAFDVFGAHLYDQDPDDLGAEESATSFSFGLDAPEAPHCAWRILDDSNFVDFNPLARPELLADSMHARTFGPFLDALRERVMPAHVTQP